jgi:hypothetical protein
MIQCFMCDKSVGIAVVFYCVSDKHMHPSAVCETCSPLNNNYLYLYYGTAFENLQKMLQSQTNVSLEDRAAFFEHWNKNPRKLIHKISPRESRMCHGCAKVGAGSFCARCERAVYCGKECQTREWKNGHKEACVPDQEIFHIRSVIFMEGCTYTRFNSNMTVHEEDEDLQCQSCGHSLRTSGMDICFFRGFSRRESVCMQCGNPYRRNDIAEVVSLVPFATTLEEFAQKLCSITITGGHNVWKKQGEK